MKAKDLAAWALQADPESEVSFEMSSGCCGDWEDMTCYDVDLMGTDYKGNIPGGYYVRILLESVPGYKSCRQAGDTKRRHEEYWANIKKVNSTPRTGTPENEESKNEST